MKAIKVMGTVDEQGQLALDSPLIIDKESRVEVIVLIPEQTESEEDNLFKKEILEDFSQAWQEAMNGETIPVEQLWDELEND
ncbi:MAG: type II toxin-antitoxin system RelN family antitoxin [Xenococcaceae cyanobacterium]